MTDCYLAFGSNMGEREKNIRSAVEALNNDRGLNLIQLSSLYHSDAMYDSELCDFVNAAAHFSCEHSPEELLKIIQLIENKLGRRRSSSRRYENRPIDIDIIFYGQLTLNTPKLTIPHPHFTKRKFVLVPLQEITLNYKVPGNSGMTIEDLLLICPDKTEVRKTV